jgi:hypothetical protein
MRSIIKTNIFLMILVTLFSASGASAAGIGNNIVVVLAGTGTAYNGNGQFEQFGLPPLDALCFDMDLVDAKTGNVIGRGSDCLSDIAPGGAGNGLQLTATTFFYFPGGTLVSRGRVTVQPVTTGSTAFTHITGAMPSPYDNNVIYGDGKFEKAYGSVRLSGAVNMSALNSAGIIVFDCVFVIDI